MIYGFFSQDLRKAIAEVPVCRLPIRPRSRPYWALVAPAHMLHVRTGGHDSAGKGFFCRVLWDK